jgi:EAL domain-containing protein (putative c-di-GMP-specific phosphodiesterase class I)
MRASNRFLPPDPGATIVLAILTLARSLRLGVTAEGVETETRFRMLRHYGCD